MNESTQNTARCVLRFFGVSGPAVEQAAAQLPPDWGLSFQSLARGGELLLALSASDQSILTQAEQKLRAQFPQDLYGRGENGLAVAATRALEEHDRLLVCCDAAAGEQLISRLDRVPGAQRVFDFGSESFSHPRHAAKLAAAGQRAARRTETGSPLTAAAGAIRAAFRITGADLAAGMVEQEEGWVLLLGSRRELWLRRVSRADNPGLWLLDMIRRAASGFAPAQGTVQRRYGLPLDADGLPAAAPVPGPEIPSDPEHQEPMQPVPQPQPGPAPTPPPDKQEGWIPGNNPPLPRPAAAAVTPVSEELPRHGGFGHGVRVVLVLLFLLAALGLAAAWYYTAGDLSALPEMLGLKEFSLSGASLL